LAVKPSNITFLWPQIAGCARITDNCCNDTIIIILICVNNIIIRFMESGFSLYRGVVKSISDTCIQGTLWNDGGSQVQGREVEDV